jgi:AAA family ATP:ADP antiporter
MPPRMSLRRIIDLRAGEARPALFSATILALLVAAHTLLETARDALFLSKLPPDRLTLVYALLAVLSLFVGAGSGTLSRRFGRRATLVVSGLVSAYVVVLLYLRPPTQVSVFVLYLASGVIGTVLMLQFWMFAAEMFSVPQGKRLFGPIGAGGVLGAALGAGAAAIGLRFMPVGGLLLAAAGLFIAASLVVSRAPAEALSPAAARGGGTLFGWVKDLGALRKDRYVPRVAWFTAIGTAAVLVADYLFKSTAAATLTKDELGPFFATFYAAINALALVVQLFLTSALVRRLGVTGSLLVLPLFLTIFGGAAGLGVGFGAALAARGSDGALRHSLHRVSGELLLLPLPGEMRDRVKPVLDTVFGRGVQAAVAAGILGLVALGLDTPRVLGATLGLLSLAWLGSALLLRQPYVDLFRRALALGQLPVDGRDDLDLASVETIMESLSSRDEDRVLAGIDVLAEHHARLVPALILYHDSPRILERALAVVATADRSDWLDLGERLLKHRDGGVRALAVRALAAANHGNVAMRALEDADPSVRSYALFFLASRGAEPPLDDERVRALLEDDRDDGLRGRRALLLAIAEHGNPRWAPVVLDIVAKDGKRAGFAGAAAGAIQRVAEHSLVPYLVEQVGSVREARAAIRDAIVSLGDPGFAEVGRALFDPSVSERARSQLPRILAAFGDQRAVDILSRRFATETSGAVRYKLLRALGKLARPRAAKSAVRLQFDRALFVDGIHKNLVEHVRIVALQVALGRGETGTAHDTAIGEVLLSLLADKAQQSLERAFRCLQIAHRNEDIQGVHGAVVRGDKRARGNALEFLDALPDLRQDVRALLRIVVDDLDASEVALRGVPLAAELDSSLRLVPDHEDAVTLLLTERDELLAALAAYHALDFGMIRLGQRALAALRERPALSALGAIPVRTRRESSHGH